MSIILILLLIDVAFLFSFLFQGCYIPQKGEWYEFRNVTLVEIRKTEIGYDLFWEDGHSRDIMTFLTDTTGCGYYVGYSVISMVKK